MTDPKRILCTKACLESLRNTQGYLTEAIGSLVKMMKSMPEGEPRDQLLDEISKLDVIISVYFVFKTSLASWG